MLIPSVAEKVIYQYTLVKKVRRKPVWQYIYGILLLAFGASLHFLGFFNVWLILAFSAAAYIIIEFAVTRALAWARPEWEAGLSRFRWMLRFPWVGYFPEQAVTFRSFRMAQMQAFLTACIAAGGASAWLEQYGAASAVFGVLWSASPRLWLLFAARKAAKNSYLIRFDANEVCIYAS